jgi:hypothetical protein
MTRGKQSQEGGDASVNIQAQGDITLGPNYLEVRQIAIDVYRANMLELREVAAEIARERAESFLDTFLRKAAEDGQTEIPEGSSPDFQYALFSAQRDYARSGDEDVGELLVQLLVDRARVEQRDLQQIVLNESLTVASKLTLDQLDALSLILILKHGGLPRVESLDEFHLVLDDLLLPFVAGASDRQSAYQHLEYVGCVVTHAFEMPAHTPFIERYPGLFTKGFPPSFSNLELPEAQKALLSIPARHKVPDRPDLKLVRINATDDEAEDELIERVGVDPGSVPRLKQLQKENLLRLEEVREYLIDARSEMAWYFDIWDETPMKSKTLTSVGIAIAHANIKKRTGRDLNLSIWM